MGPGGDRGNDRAEFRDPRGPKPPKAELLRTAAEPPTATPGGRRRPASTSLWCSRPERGRARPRPSSAVCSPGRLGEGWERAAQRLAERADRTRRPRDRGRAGPRRRRGPGAGRGDHLHRGRGGRDGRAGPPASWRPWPPAARRRAGSRPPCCRRPPSAPRRARALLGTLDHLAVRTIHAFCRGLLADHPLEAGVHPDLTIDADGQPRRGGRARDGRGRPARRLRRSRRSPSAGPRRPGLRTPGDRRGADRPPARGACPPPSWTEDPFGPEALAGFRRRLAHRLPAPSTA